MRNRQIAATVSGAAVVGVVTIVLVFGMLGSDRDGVARAAGENETTATLPVRVEVTKPVHQPLTRVLRMPATLMAGEQADLYAKASGFISTVAVDIGSRVKKGEALLAIDVPEMADELQRAQALITAKRARVDALKARILQAESRIATARGEVQRYAAEHRLWKITTERRQQLLDENAISRQNFDEVESKLAMADAKLQIARSQVIGAQAEHQAVEADVAVAQSEVAVEEADAQRIETLMKYATVRAPFDGVITERFVDPGAFVRSAADGATAPLLTIANVDYIRLVLQVPETDALFVRIGTDVDIDIKALRGETLSASVTRTAMALKANTRTMRVEIDLDNKDEIMSPGMYAQVAVTLEFKQRALVIPSKAIRVRGRELSVLVADGAVARRISVKIGYDDGILAEVIEGLQGNEQIITSASSAVTPGAPVAVNAS